MKQKIKDKIERSDRFQNFLEILKKVRIKKRNISLYDIIVVFIEKVRKDEIFERAYSVAFNFTLAIFPAIIFLFTLIPYFTFIPELEIKIRTFLQDVMPHSLYIAASSTIDDILSRPRGGLLSFGFILALYLSTNGMDSLMQAFNKCYRTVERRGFLKTRLIATGLTFTLALVLILAIALLIVGQLFIHLVENYYFVENYAVALIILLRFVIVFVIFLTGISCIYYLAPAVHDRWRFFSYGSIIATFLSMGISYLFSYYINNFATYNKLYGSIGALIAIMIWLFLVSVVLLIGFEVNASIDKASKNDLERQITQRVESTKAVLNPDNKTI